MPDVDGESAGSAGGKAGGPRVLPMFSAPPRVFFAVMVPICALMAAVAVLGGFPAWARISAALVIVVSLDAIRRGYLHRLILHPDRIVYRTLLRSIEIPWSRVRLIGRYVPPDRNRTTAYVFVTGHDHAPADRREIDDHTLQLQDRPGLLELLESCRSAGRGVPGDSAPRNGSAGPGS